MANALNDWCRREEYLDNCLASVFAVFILEKLAEEAIVTTFIG
jgi:hypothetical protein